jgi:transposase
LPKEEIIVDKKELFRTKRSYVPVEQDKRRQLINLVEKEECTIKEAALKLKINYSTAKHIIKMYKRTGEISNLSMAKKKADQQLQELEAQILKKN